MHHSEPTSSISSARPLVRLVTFSDPLEPGPWRSGAQPLSNTSAKPSLPTADGAQRLAKSVLAAMPIPAARNSREKDRMKPRNRIFIIMGVLLVIALCWYFFSTKHTSDLQLIGTVDANEVIVSSRIQGRIQSLAVDEGQTVTAGQLVATIEAQDLADARNAAEATVSGDKYKLAGSRDTEEQTQGDTLSQVTAAEAQLRRGSSHPGPGPGAVRTSGCRHYARRSPGPGRRHQPASPR